MTLVWIPNTLTMGNLLLGFISLYFSSQGQFLAAGFLILGAALLDGLDGPAARVLKVSSPIGKELDSLADCVAFGVSPGFLAYNAYLSGLTLYFFNKPIDMGIFIASIFPICAAYRLARFNVTTVPNSFTGLPSPIVGIIMALVPICFKDIVIPRIAFIIAFVLIALLMVSTVRYSKPQSYLFKNIQGIKLTLLIIVIVILLIYFKFWTVFFIISLYLLSGLLSFIIQFIQEHKY